MKKFLTLVLICPWLLGALEFQSIKLDSVMTDQEKRETGVARLSSNERAQLEIWLTNYTLKLNSQKTQTPSNGRDNQRRHQEQLRGVDSDYNPLGKVYNVDQIYDDGESVYLSDGSIWEVMPEAKDDSFKWGRGDRIAVYRSRNSRFPYRLVNLDDGKAVNAQVNYAPTEAKEEDQERRDPSLKTIDKNVQEGAYILMDDGTRWVISPWDRFKAKLWLGGEQVKVSRSGGIVYPYRLLNKNTDESAEAKLQKGAPVPQPSTKP